jgi:lipopolysaccharide transport system permease protein
MAVNEALEPETVPEEAAEVHLKPRRGWVPIDWRAIWRHRELLFFLTWRDIKVRYKQTVLGVLWAFMQPFLKLVVFSVIFGQLIKRDPGEAEYPVFAFAALLPWQFFQESLSRGSQSVVANAGLITKVFFPRLIIPLAAIGACLVDFAIAFVIMLGLMLYYGIVPTVHILMLPPMVALTIMVSLGVGSFLSALNVAYRDFRHAIPFMLQIWFFLTPVVYPLSVWTGVLPEWLRWVPQLNPMVGIVDGYRAAIIGEPFQWGSLGIAAGIAVASVVVGALYFRRIERYFADMI